MKMKLMTLAAMSLFAIGAQHHYAVAADNADATGEAMKSAKDDKADADMHAKKTKRKAAKHARKMKGTDTMSKDAKDSANDVKDDTKNAADKANNKINE